MALNGKQVYPLLDKTVIAVQKSLPKAASVWVAVKIQLTKKIWILTYKAGFLWWQEMGWTALACVYSLCSLEF